jgi:predicted lipoprotein with Yx(FWY)xxD motif
MRKTTLFLGMFAVLLASYAYAADKMPDGIQARKADSGMVVLADSKGMTLYTFDKDMKGMSMCKDKCAMNWPAAVASADAKPTGDWTIVTRDDGTKQWAYKGMPLYTFAKDTKAGDTTGDGVGKVWHVIVP